MIGVFGNGVTPNYSHFIGNMCDEPLGLRVRYFQTNPHDILFELKTLAVSDGQNLLGPRYFDGREDVAGCGIFLDPWPHYVRRSPGMGQEHEYNWDPIFAFYCRGI